MKVKAKLNLPTDFDREVGENQILCPECGGVGLKIEGNYIISCPKCSGGIVDLCKYCGKPANYRHKCEGIEDHERNRRHESDVAMWNAGNKISLVDAIQKFEMLYVDNFDEYVKSDDIEDFIDNKVFDEEKFYPKELRIYGTYEVEMSIDATNIIENACENLFEDAIDNISSNAFNEMQSFLNEWVKKNNPGKSYMLDYNYSIVLPCQKVGEAS